MKGNYDWSVSGFVSSQIALDYRTFSEQWQAGSSRPNQTVTPFRLPRGTRELPALAGRRVLVVDDDPMIIRVITRGLSDRGYEVTHALTGAEAITRMSTHPPDACVLDRFLGDVDGIALLGQLREIDPTLTVVMVSGAIDVADTVRALRGGAEDVMAKPFDLSLLDAALSRGLVRTELQRSRRLLDSQVTDPYGVLDPSPVMQRTIRTLQQAAARDIAILFSGEPGSGKRALAEVAHQLSARASQPFISVTLGGNTDQLCARNISSALATLQEASGLSRPTGSLLLTDVRRLGPATTRVLEQVLDPRLAAERNSAPVDVRFFATTSLDTRQLLSQGGVGAAILQRLSLITVSVPSLHERGEEAIEALARRILYRMKLESDDGPTALTTRALNWLASLAWPGNVPQLRRVMRDGFIQAIGAEQLDIQHLEPALSQEGLITADGATSSPSWTLAAMERRHIGTVLKMTGGNLTRAASILDISRTTLYKKVADYNLSAEVL